MNKRISLKDIASRVGVSTALVSYVLNGQEKEKRVGAEIAERIRIAARELNYNPNHIARSLRKGATHTIGLIVADIANPFFGNLARVIEDQAARYGYTVIFGSSDEDPEKSDAVIKSLLNRQVDGFIIAPAEHSDQQISELVTKEIPLVLIDRFLNGIDTSYVVLDNYSASHHAASYLLRKGLKKVAMIGYQSEMIHMRDRFRGYAEAMRAHGMEQEICQEEIRYAQVEADMESVLNDFLNRPERPDAVVFATNALTIAGLYYFQKHRIRIPEDLAVIGFDGNPAFDFFYSPLTYLRQPIETMGSEAVRVLLEGISGRKDHQQIKLKHSLVERDSTSVTFKQTRT